MNAVVLLEAAPELPREAVPWWVLSRAFMWSLFGWGLLIVVVAVVAGYWPRWSGRSSWWMPSQRWDFTEYWASNLTLVAAALTPLFTGTVNLRTDVAGLDHLVTVTSAASAAMVGMAVLILLTSRVVVDETAKTWVPGWLIASWVALSGAGAQFGVLIYAVGHLNIGGQQTTLVVLGAVGMLVLVVFGGVSVYRPLKHSGPP